MSRCHIQTKVPKTRIIVTVVELWYYKPAYDPCLHSVPVTVSILTKGTIKNFFFQVYAKWLYESKQFLTFI